MSKITVVIATANRPKYLQTALESVVSQTNDLDLDSVLVSENGGNRESEEIANRFRGVLPIRYLFRSPSLDPVAHVLDLFGMNFEGVVAFLCDDDWWFDGHLYRSCCELDRWPGAASVFSACAFLASEQASHAIIYRPEPLVAAAGSKDFLKPWVLSFETVCAAAWLETPFHFSTMVARAPALRLAAARIFGAHPNFTDRLLEAHLSAQGEVIFFPQPSAGIRIHDQNWSVGKSWKTMRDSDREGTVLIEALASSRGFSCWEYWKGILPGLAKTSKSKLAKRFLWIHGSSVVKQNGLEMVLFSNKLEKLFRLLALYYGGAVVQLLPPIFARLIRRLGSD